MKIVIIGARGFDNLEYHLENVLTQEGHQCTLVDYFTRVGKLNWYVSRLVESVDLALANYAFEKINHFEPNLIICTYRDIHPHLIFKLKAHNYTIIHLNPDTITTLQRHQIIASPYDFYFSKCPIMVEILCKIGLNAHRFHECFNPQIHHSTYSSKADAEDNTNIDIMILGNLNPHRVKFIQALDHEKYVVKCFGIEGYYYPTSLKSIYTNKFITGTEKANLCYGAKLVLNNFAIGEIRSVNNKFFEIGGVGGVQLTDYTEQISEFYPTELLDTVTYSSIDEIPRKVEKLLQDSALRLYLSELNKKTFSTYTYQNLIHYIFKIVFG